jgi:hypothetical protein
VHTAYYISFAKKSEAMGKGVAASRFFEGCCTALDEKRNALLVEVAR